MRGETAEMPMERAARAAQGRPDRRNGLSHVFEVLSNDVDSLDGAIDTLEQRLGDILGADMRPVEKTLSPVDAADDPATSDFTRRFGNVTRRLEGRISRIHDIIDRIDL